MTAKFQPRVAEVRATLPDDFDWSVKWSGSAYMIQEIQEVVDLVESAGGRAWVFIPDTNTCYKPSKYPHVLWVRLGIELLKGVHTVNRKASA